MEPFKYFHMASQKRKRDDFVSFSLVNGVIINKDVMNDQSHEGWQQVLWWVP